MSINLEDMRVAALNKVEAASYPSMLCKLVTSCIPTEDRNILMTELPEDLQMNNISDDMKEKIQQNEANGFTRYPYRAAVDIIGPMLAKVVSAEELKRLIESVKYDVGTEYKKKIPLYDFEAIIIATENIMSDIIINAESAEGIDDADNKLKAVINDTEIPDIVLSIRNTVKKEFQKSKDDLDKIKAKDSSIIPDDGGSGLDFDDETFNKPIVDPETQEQPDDGSEEVTAPVEPGEDGELFNESFTIKYSDLLNNNISYVVSNVVSKMVFKYMIDNNVQELPPVIKTQIRLISYMTTTFGIMLNCYGLMSYERFGEIVERAYLEN